MKIASRILAFSIALCVFTPSLFGADVIELKNPLRGGVNNVADFLKLVFDQIILPIGGVVVAIAVIYTGFMFVTARGSEEKLKTAKRAFLYTVIGAAILLGAWTITQVIQNTIEQVTDGTGGGFTPPTGGGGIK